VLVSYTVAIRKNETGEVRHTFYDYDHTASEYATADELLIYLWTEGNNGCDCNLAADFARAGGEDTPRPVDLPCSDGKYTALYAEFPGGRRLAIKEVV
jgi:hypothetical protein